MDLNAFTIYILDAHAFMIYVHDHELKIKLLKSKFEQFECCPVFPLRQILVPWNSDEFLSC